jgi:hypothetical protein
MWVKFTFAVESIDLIDRCLRVVYTAEDTSLSPYHGTVSASLDTLSLPVEEAKDVLRELIVGNAPIDYWQSQLAIQQLQVPDGLVEVIGESFEVTTEEYELAAASVSAALPDRGVEI